MARLDHDHSFPVGRMSVSGKSLRAFGASQAKASATRYMVDPLVMAHDQPGTDLI